ncbi:MAG: helix-hairpin-helix domain-containing protein, partial [Thermoplasmata archaeon]
ILFYTNLNKQMVLSAVKSALILNAMIDTFPEKLLADKFGIYEIDILLLRKNAKKLLDNASVIFNILEKKEHAKECKLVSYMLQNGFSEDAAIMCKIQGLGAKRCKKLISNGIKNVYDLSQTKEEEISKICRIETNSAKQIISDARKIAKEWMNTKSHDNALSIFNKISEKGTMSPACPHRLKRSLALSVKACGEYKWIVSGGREEHKVIRFVGLECDCKDFMSRRKDCKHILAVKREIGILPIVKDENDISLRDAFSYTKYHEYSGEENG